MKHSRIAVVGSYNMDVVVSAPRMPLEGESIFGQSIRYIPGGKGANQAVGCARLGAQVSMIGAVGDDAFSQDILQAMKDENINLAGTLQSVGVTTGTAAIVHTMQDNRIIIIPGANHCCTPEHVNRCGAIIAQSDVLIIQLEVPLDSVQTAVSIAFENNIPIILNPAPAQMLPDSLLRQISVLTPNETEFEQLTGTSVTEGNEGALLSVMRDWELQYNHRLCLTRGKRGCSYIDNGRLVTIPAPQTEVVDTTGAGDAFNAALAFGMSCGWSFQDTVSFAVAAASLSVSRFGAQAGMPTYKEVISNGLNSMNNYNG